MWQMLGVDHPMEAHRIDSRAIYDTGRMADSAEGVAAFLEKRPPTGHCSRLVPLAARASVRAELAAAEASERIPPLRRRTFGRHHMSLPSPHFRIVTLRQIRYGYRAPSQAAGRVIILVAGRPAASAAPMSASTCVGSVRS